MNEKLTDAPPPCCSAEFDRDEMLDVIADLRAWLRVGTFDEADGERDAYDRATRLLDR